MAVMDRVCSEVNKVYRKALTLKEMDEYLHAISDSPSIFSFTEKQWRKWRQGEYLYFFYIINEKSIMFKMDIMLDHGISPSTIVKVVDWNTV
ncbi:hypothetical protein [Bacillus sp. FJAT-42315]|uniref:hypothetical protein n=1 Tax=Bacillus sp. FJAT-42315 TaxID=2014077 RepID=UPI000B9E077D|nr:hypothetical protein [Bacillus sp. FJAT-42315]OZI12012.1 hypothetical protein CEW92_08595 [Bacillaceae bacterium SAS-127]PAQ14943.1 hypothetical protein CD798_08625 [Bacillaceae bacterium SAOS 7]